MLYAHLQNQICTAGTSEELINLDFEAQPSFDMKCMLLYWADLITGCVPS